MRRLFFAWIVVLGCLSALAGHASADDRAEHGDWTSQFQDGMGEATTHENGMATFGMLCVDNACRYYFANNIDCDVGITYPLMVTTSQGALSVNAVCESMESANGAVLLYWFPETDTLNDAFSKTTSLGFAFPLQNGQFKVSTFSMDGYNDAIARMVNGLRERQSERPDMQHQQQGLDS